jgi:hypothetical protein
LDLLVMLPSKLFTLLL